MSIAAMLSYGLWLAPAFAEVPRLMTMSLDGLTITMGGEGALPKPSMEVWEGGSADEPTEMVILEMKDVAADVANLQNIANDLVMNQPQFKRILISSLGDDNENIQVVIEVSAKTIPNLRPSLWQSSIAEWHLALTSTGEPDATLPELAEDKVISPETAEVSPAMAKQKVKTASVGTGNDAEKLFRELKKVKAHNRALEDKVQELESKLKSGDPAVATTSQTEAEIAALRQQISELERVVVERDGKLAAYNDYLRPYDPELAQGMNPEKFVLQNLRGALLKLSNQLQSTQGALNAQQAITMELANQLAVATSNPNIPQTPGLLVYPQEPKSTPELTVSDVEPVQPEEKQSTVAVASKSKAVDPKLAAVDAAKRELELKTAVREHPKNYTLALKLQQFYVNQHAYGKAEDVLLSIIARNTKVSDAYRELAKVYLLGKRPLEAQAVLETYKRLKPKDGFIAELETQIQNQLHDVDRKEKQP